MKKVFTILGLMGSIALSLPGSANAADYDVEVQWGGDTAPWNKDAIWSIGARQGQFPIEVRFASGDGVTSDGGNGFMGQIKYAQSEGMLGLRATRIEGNIFRVETKTGNADWVLDGNWVIGGRKDQAIIKFEAKSKDGGKTLSGTTTYAGEGPIGFKAVAK